MGIRDFLFGKKQVPGFQTPVCTISCSVHPLRLPARKADYVELEIGVANIFEKELLTSVVVTLPKPLGFEQSALSHQKEIRLGHLMPGESKTLRVMVWGTARTDPGTYPVNIFALSHYHDYSYVLNESRKTIELRAA